MHEGAMDGGARPSEGEQPPAPGDWTAVVFTGGASRRMGQDKAMVRVGGRTLLGHVLHDVGADQGRPVVIVGPHHDRRPGRTVRVCQEDPPGGGPAAAVAAALDHVATPLVALIATDMPFAASLLAELATELADRPDADAVIPLDRDGHRQPLAGVYRTGALRDVAPPGTGAGASMRSLVAELAVVEVTPTHAWRLRDLDTPADLSWARSQVAGPAEGPHPRPPGFHAPATGILGTDDERTTMDKTATWVSTAAQALGIDGTIDTQTVLDVARDVAHGVERPAAPLTTYLLGVAVGRGADPAEAAATIRSLLDEADA